MASNKAFVFKKIPNGWPVAGEHITTEQAAYDANVATPADGIVVQSLYASFDPYMRGRMRSADVKTYNNPFPINGVIDNRVIAKVLRSNNAQFPEGETVIGRLPIQEYVAVDAEMLKNLKILENPLGIEDIRVFLGALGMPGLTAYSSLYEIGKPKKGETIFVSAASGAVGALVGQLAKLEGLRVIGSVGSQEKLDFITKELGFDGGFNYKTEKPAAALARLAPQGIDIYYENVGGEHLAAAIDALNNFGRVVVCGFISEYNSEPNPPPNFNKILYKRLTVRGFIVGDANMGPLHDKDHQERVQKYIKEGSFKAITHETVGIDNAAEGLIGLLAGKNYGKAVLKF
jgi:NADPH-dependent curcumin reductase CurA